MRIRILIITACLYTVNAYAQQAYDVSQIPKTMLPYASAVIRNSQETVEIKDLDNVIYHVKQAITVLNKNGDKYARINLDYDKTSQVKNVKGAIYNESGFQIGKFAERDFSDVAVSDGFSMFLDSRAKRFAPAIVSYPYTIESEYEIRYKQSLNLPSWDPNDNTGLSIESSTFKVICKPDFKLRYKEMNLPEKVSLADEPGGLKSYTWKIGSLKATRDEPYSPNTEVYGAAVKLAPERFVYDGVSGSFTDWTTLGKWIYSKLLVNRDEVPQLTVSHIAELTQNISDPKLKAKKIYEYMQQKTRYVSVQVGIGGYQPFPASDVDQLSYGDCKALVNYTKALLKTVNIDSWYCVVEAGDRKVSLMPDFASMEQGNHIILCIPFKNDTTWLECTNQKIPFGFLSDFTDDRTVLACTPEGGKLMHTPKYSTEINLTNRSADFKIDESGLLTGNMTTHFEGTNYDDRYSLMDEPYVEQVKKIKEEYAINNLEVSKLELKQDKKVSPVTTEHMELNARDYASVNGGKYYFLANSANRMMSAPREIRNRQTDVYINRGYTDEDQISYTIPSGYHVDRTMLNLSIQKPFGNFTVSMDLQGNKLTYKRKLQLKDGTYSKDTYQDLVDFYQAVVDADSYDVVLAKNN